MSTDQPLASRSFASLPELLILLLPNLTPPDLLQCIQICQLWNQVFVPGLWRSIDDEKLAWPRFLRHHKDRDAESTDNSSNNASSTDNSFVRCIFHKYGRFIQHLDLHYWVTIRAAISSSSTSPGWGQLSSLRVTHSPSNNRWTLMFPPKRNSTGATSLGNEEQKALVQAVWRLAQQNSTTLTSFRLDQSFSRPRSLLNTSEAAEVMYNALKNMPNLIELEIAHASADLDRVLHLTSPHLECLRAPGLFQMMGTDGQLLHEAYTSIRKVELSNDTDTRAVFSLLRYLPNLESLSLSGFEQEFFQNDEVEGLEAQTRMDNTPSRSLHRLSLCKVRFHDNRVMAIILPWIPELREFSCDLLRMDMSAALVKHCTHLEIVRELGVLGGNYDAGTKTRPIDDVLPLLRGCPSLKVLDMVAHRILGDSFIDCEIACLERLETFRCQIVGMYWLDGIHSLEMLKRILARYSGEGEGDEGSERGPWQAGTRAAEMRLFDKAYRSQERGPALVGTRCGETRLLNEVYRNQERYRKVYQQLSKMTQLRVLDLGQEYRTVFDPYCGPDGEDSHNSEDEEHHPPKYNRYSPPIPDTLDLTLESGFDQLETLKELEVFGFEGVGHHMEKAELNWMAEKWPKLRVMRGIHEDILPKVEPDAKRTELREYMQLLRPDVVHETLYKLPVFWWMEAADVWSGREKR